MSELWMEYRAYRKAKSRFNASLSRGAWAVEATRLNVVSDGEAQQLAMGKQMRINEQRAKQGRAKRFFKGALTDIVHSLRNSAFKLVKGRSLEQLQATEIVEDQKHWHKPHEVRLRKGKAGLGVRFALEGDRHGMVVVKQFRRPDGEIGPAEKSSRLQRGYAIVSVNGEPVDCPAGEHSVTRVAQMVRASDSLVRLSVRKPRKHRAADLPSAAAATSKTKKKAAGSDGLGDNSDAVVALDGDDDDGGGDDQNEANDGAAALLRGIQEWLKGDYDMARKSYLPSTPSLRNAKLDEVQKLVTFGSFDAIRDTVIYSFYRCNEQNRTHRDTLLHICAREGYVKGIEFMCNEANRVGHGKHQKLATETCNSDGLTALQLAFAPPHMTAKDKGARMFSADVTEHDLELLNTPEIKPPMPHELMEDGEEAGRVQIVRMLLDAGAKPRVSGPSDITPLHLAAQWGWAGACEALLKAGVPGDAVDLVDRCTPLIFACRHGHAAAIRALCEGDQLVHETITLQSRLGTAFGLACASKAADELVEFLIEHGADACVDVPDRRDRTPLMLACKKGRKRAASVLLRRTDVGRVKEALRGAPHQLRVELETKLRQGYFKPVSKEKLRRKQERAQEAARADAAGLTLTQYRSRKAEVQHLEHMRHKHLEGGILAERSRYRRQGPWEQCRDPMRGNRVHYVNHDTKEIRFDKPKGWVDDPGYIASCSCCNTQVFLDGGQGKMHHVTRGAKSRWVHRAD